jgi:1-acyl-sn-glycerol-3-phosphate acyltransferase
MTRAGIAAALPEVELTFVAKHSLFKQPVVGQLLNATRAVPVAKPNDPDLPQEKQMKPEERQKLNNQVKRCARAYATFACRLRLLCKHVARACTTHLSVD